jgi:OOP family OmpA-OmpF porin
MIKIYLKGNTMLKKLSLFLVSLLGASTLHAQGDVSIKYGLTTLDNDDGWEFKNHTLAGDISFDLGYALKPRVDLAYVNIDDDKKWGGVSSLIQGALSAQYGKTFDMVSFPHELYLFGGLGYEYVVDGHDTFDSLPFFQAGLGAKYGISENVNILAEFKALQVFDSNNASDDEDNEFTFFVGLNFPFGGVSAPTPKTRKVEKKVEKVVLLDSDHDGVLDNVDKCENTPQGARVDARGCAIVALMEEKIVKVADSDHDGVIDSKDLCPDTKPGTDVQDNGCARNIVFDTDNDGVTDDVDKCINSRYGAKVGADGCEITATPQALNLDINFESNSADIKQESMAKIKKFAKLLKNQPEGTIVKIYGYTDSSGDAKKNKELSSKRAFAVRKALIKAGVKKSMVRAYGKGSMNPIASNETKEGRAKNRRIEAVIVH